MKPDVTIVIPAFEEQDRLGASLEKIVEYLRSIKTRAEIIVVDDGSKDETAAATEAFLPGLYCLGGGVVR